MNLVLGIIGVIALMAVLGRFRKTVDTHGSAGWLPLTDATTRGFFNPWKINWRNLKSERGLLVGDYKRGTLLPLYYHGASNILTCGAPRSSKGIGMLLPNALRWSNMLIFDPGGEITAVAIKEWRRKGYAIYVLNPSEIFSHTPYSLPSDGLNVIDNIDPKSKTFAADAGFLAGMMLTRTGRENDQIFNNKAEAGLKALMMHIASVDPEPEGGRNLISLRRYVTGNEDGWKSLIKAMQANSSDEAIMNQANDWQRDMDNTPKTFSNFVTTMESATNWLDDPMMRDAVSRSGVRMEDLKGFGADGKKLKGAVVAIVLELPYLETHAAYVRLAIGSALLTMQRGKKARKKVLFMIDEFPALGKMESIVRGLATLGKYRVWLQVVTQTIGQLEDLYGKGWSRIEGGCELRQYIAARDLATSEHVSKLCGEATFEEVREGQIFRTARPLITSDEVRRLRDDEQIVFFGNSRPACLKIRPYWERPMLQGRFNDNPHHAKTPPLPLRWPFLFVRGVFERVKGLALAPSLAFWATLIIGGVVAFQPKVLTGKEYAYGRGYACSFTSVTESETRFLYAGECPFIRLSMGGRE